MRESQLHGAEFTRGRISARKLNQLHQAKDPGPSGGLRLMAIKLAQRARLYLAPTAIGGLRPWLFAQTEAWASGPLNRTPCLPTRRGLGRSPINHCIGALGLHWTQHAVAFSRGGRRSWYAPAKSSRRSSEAPTNERRSYSRVQQGPPSNPRRGTRGWGGVVDEEPAPERGNAA